MQAQWTGNIVALPNNRVRATSPALWETGEGAPDFKPSQYLHAREIHNSYLDPAVTFNNLYKGRVMNMPMHGMKKKKKGYAKGGATMKKNGYSKGGAMPMGRDPKQEK